MPESNVSIPSTFVSDWECYDTNSVSSKKLFATFSRPHGPPRVDLPGRMLLVFESQTLRERVSMTTVSDVCPTENFRALFS